MTSSKIMYSSTGYTLMQVPQHFVHEIERKAYDFLDINIPPQTNEGPTRSHIMAPGPPQKRAYSMHAILLVKE